MRSLPEYYDEDKSDAELLASVRAGSVSTATTKLTSKTSLYSVLCSLPTACTPGFIPADAVLAKTVQVCSIKVTDLRHFSCPLQVHGVVAARDAVDQRRNPIFLRPRDDCQILDESHPFLHLTGPVRAILSEEPVDIEIQLRVKGKTASEDRGLISDAFYYEGDNGDRVRTSRIEKHSCTLELCTQQLSSSIQATIFGAVFILTMATRCLSSMVSRLFAHRCLSVLLKTATSRLHL